MNKKELIDSLEGRIIGGQMHGGGYIHVPQDEAETVLELLKPLEARVLTYDEVMALPNGEETEAPVVMEQKVPVGEWDKGTLCQWRGARFVQERDHYYYNRDTYGKIWRCWTALPTKAQREGAEWNDA